jgi:hypothetical protein
MTLEDISVVFGDPVELSFEQALHRESGASAVLATDGTEYEKGDSDHVEANRSGHGRDAVSIA